MKTFKQCDDEKRDRIEGLRKMQDREMAMAIELVGDVGVDTINLALNAKEGKAELDDLALKMNRLRDLVYVLVKHIVAIRGGMA